MDHVASSIGPPICADKTTSQLNPVQFAKICVRYTVGDTLPEVIKVVVLDAETKALSSSTFAEIEVSYPQRPLVCNGCKSLGHLVGACPSVKRVWVPKVHNDQPSVQNDQPPAADTAAMPNTTVEHQANKPPSFELFVELTGESFAKGTSVAAPVPAATVDKLEEWTTVKGKKSSPPKTRSQLKKARKAVGRNSPQK